MPHRRRHRGKPGGSTIRSLYRGLGILNTLSVLLSGNPTRILRHLFKRRVVRKLGRLF